MTVVYIAGPFRASTAWAVVQNVRRAEEMALEVARLGAMPLCPHTNTQNFHGLLDDDFWLRGTLELLRRSDAIVVCDGWRRSTGTLGEIADATVRGIPIFYHLHTLSEWLRPGRAAAVDGQAR